MARIKAIDVVDAEKALRLHVTQDDITQADIKDPGNCAVARACKRELHVTEARVHLSYVYLRPNANENKWVRYMTPRAMRDQMISFDRGGAFEPSEFDLKPM
jgi:hypothetical protein